MLSEYRMSEHGEQQGISRDEHCGLIAVRRVAAMLDLDPNRFHEGQVLPRGWHFFLLGGETRRSALRQDGFPGFGVSIPDLEFPRLLLAGRTVEYLRDIPVGASLQRRSFIKSLNRKTSASGPMAIVTVQHDLRLSADQAASIAETQTYILLDGPGARSDASGVARPIRAEHQKTVIPDETLLFQYSALGFNSHKIHIDRTYAREVEGLPDLVVNGGLSTLLLTEFMRTGLGLVPASIRTRHIAPLFCGRPITLAADPEGAHWRFRAFDDKGNLAVDMEVVAR
jgi:3-methylfumaryl-CoA hydratase